MTEVQNLGDDAQDPAASGPAAGESAAGAAERAAITELESEVTEPASEAAESAAAITPLVADIAASGAGPATPAAELAEPEVTGAAVEITRSESEVTASDAADPAPAAEAAAPAALPVDPQEFDDEDELTEDEFRSALEAMLLVVDAPAPVELLASALRDHPIRVETALREMSAELTARRSGMDLRYVGDGWRYYTRTEFAPYVERMLLDGARSKLTRAALETLAVIAYRQPVTRARVSAVRGVNVDGVIRTLLARGLIAEAGADPETNGTLYITTELFLERIGLASLADLPPLAPLLPGVDLIDEINESLDTDPRYTRLKKPAEADINLGTDD